MIAVDAERVFGPGSTTAIGSLPHRDPEAAAACALDASTLVCIPSLPRRSPAESMVAQAVSSLPGVTLGQYGSVAIDVCRLDPEAVADVNLRGESFCGLRAFLDLAAARGHSEPVKWQFIGPVTLGMSLLRAGAPEAVAFRLAVGAVRAHLAVIAAEVARRLPSSGQVVVLDEPCVGPSMSPEFPIPPEEAVDLMSEAMAVLEGVAVVGLHCCARADIASLLASGPRLLSIPVSSAVVEAAGYVHDFVERGGIVAWGAVATDGPVLNRPERSWRALRSTWQALGDRGGDVELIRARSLITPQCGLGMHSMAAAQRVLELTAEVGRRVADDVPASQLR